jgi:hypothetical protein
MCESMQFFYIPKHFNMSKDIIMKHHGNEGINSVDRFLILNHSNPNSIPITKVIWMLLTCWNCTSGLNNDGHSYQNHIGIFTKWEKLESSCSTWFNI